MGTLDSIDTVTVDVRKKKSEFSGRQQNPSTKFWKWSLYSKTSLEFQITTNEMQRFLNLFIFYRRCTCFRRVSPPIIRSTRLYIQLQVLSTNTVASCYRGRRGTQISNACVRFSDFSQSLLGESAALCSINPLNAELNPICYLLALLAHHFLHVSRIRFKSLTLRLLMSYIYIYIYIYIWSAYSWCF